MFEYLVSPGKKVTILGRIESQRDGARNSLIRFGLWQQVVKEHPEVDCLVINAVVQRDLDMNGLI